MTNWLNYSLTYSLSHAFYKTTHTSRIKQLTRKPRHQSLMLHGLWRCITPLHTHTIPINSLIHTHIHPLTHTYTPPHTHKTLTHTLYTHSPLTHSLTHSLTHAYTHTSLTILATPREAAAPAPRRRHWPAAGTSPRHCSAPLRTASPVSHWTEEEAWS
jgi:hypothetical protein